MTAQRTPIRVAFACTGDARDVKFWSGTPYYMLKAVEKSMIDVVNFSPLSVPVLPVAKAVARLYRGLRIPGFSPFHALATVRQYRHDFSRKLARTKPDIVLAVAASNFATVTPTDIPVVYSSDATFELISDYPRYRNLSARAHRWIDDLERRMIQRADALLYPSEWAANSAIRTYGAEPGKVHVVPWGANMDTVPTRDEALAPRRPGPLRLLFIGADWERKGGETALRVLDLLHRDGCNAEMTICGSGPPHSNARPGLELIPFLDKNNPADRDRLFGLFQDADLFILPTRAECYGIVFCEAAAFGVPSIAPAVGGVPAAARDGLSARLVGPLAPPEAYVAAIRAVTDRPGTLEALRVSARDTFERELNWHAFGAHAREIFEDLVDRGPIRR